MELRKYQLDAASAVISELSGEATGTLLLLPTGAGKTQVACEVMRRWLALHPADRVLFLAHRDELIMQAHNRIDSMLGFTSDIEKAELHDGKQSGQQRRRPP